jgi:cobalt-zinc-cadmium efflux system outer membrane protein
MSTNASHPSDARGRARARRMPLIIATAIALTTFDASPASPPPTVSTASAGVSNAAPETAPDLTLQHAIRAALAHNPALGAFPIDVRAGAARVDRAALDPALEISFEVENFLGTGEARGLQGLDATLSLSRVVELGGKRDARVSAASAELDSVAVERQASELDVLTEVTRRFIDVAESQARVDLAKSSEQLASATVSASRRRVDAGKAPHAELDRAEIQLQRARLDAARADRQRTTALRQLAASWGERDAVLDGMPLGRVRADLYTLPALVDFETLRASWASTPDALRFASAARVRDAELRLAATQRKPDLAFSVGVRRLEGTNDAALVASVSMPIGTAARAGNLLAEAQANRDRVDVERAVAEVNALATLHALHAELSQTMAEAAALRDAVLPRTQEALTETEYAYQRGRYSYLELVDAQREFLATRATLIEESAHVHRLRAEIERLTRTPIDAPDETR